MFRSPEVTVVRRPDREDPIDNRRLRASLARGDWIRVAPGVFVPGEEWATLHPRARHRLRVVEGVRRLTSVAVISHSSAAAIHDIDILGPWPSWIEVSCPPSGGGRSTPSIRRHPRDLDSLDAQWIDGILVTTPAQTALDLSRTLPFAAGVAAVDQAIRTGRRGGALTTTGEVLALMAASPHRGDTRALRAISFADAGAANVRESEGRVLIARLGFPKPRVQERRVLQSGRLVFGDFFWPEHDHWGELDGEGKYLSPEFGRTRDPRSIVLDEKRRENEIRREVRGFSRWEPVDQDAPRRLYDILTSDGLPSSLPRP